MVTATKTRTRKNFGRLGKTKPSEFLRKAIDDLKWFKRRPECVVNMAVFLCVRGKGSKAKCQGCLGAAYMYHKYGPIKGEININAVNEHKANYTDLDFYLREALDKFHLGEIRAAMEELGIKQLPNSFIDNVDVWNYSSNSRSWFRDMRKVINILERVGF